MATTLCLNLSFSFAKQACSFYIFNFYSLIIYFIHIGKFYIDLQFNLPYVFISTKIKHKFYLIFCGSLRDVEVWDNIEHE
jgi:hypothetical protein